MSDQYYTLEEVMKKLGRSKSTVIRETNAGKIPSEGEKRNRRYPKEAVDAIAELQQEKEEKQPRFVFSPSSPNDLWAEVSIGRNLYGEDDIVPYKRLLEWREINDEIFMSLKEHGKVVAYSSLMPLDEDILRMLIEDQMREREIPLTAIRQWTEPQLSVYVSSITVKPSGDAIKEKELGRIIIQQTVKWALSLDRQSNIKNWYGIGATKEGQHLFESLGFTEILSLYDGERKGYYLEDVKAPVKLINMLLKKMRS